MGDIMDEKVKTELDNIVRVLAATGTVSQIFLFGSYARGEETPDSDIDLCVLTPMKDKRNYELIVDYLLSIHKQKVRTMPLDLLAYNQDRFYDHISQYPKSFERDIVDKGLLLYERQS
jgi:predicted nucleotidyltransferase